jgi:5-methylcytosine-specific restriction endonuclease McrA
VFELRPVPKPTSKRKKKGDIPPKVREAVKERDKWCVRCGRPGVHLHHIQYRSQQGKHTVDNLVLLCVECHHFAHSGKEGREWFERYRQRLKK